MSSITFLNRYDAYYANNVWHTNFYNLLRLGRAYFSEDDFRFLLDLFENSIHAWVRLCHNAWFNGIFMSQGPYDPTAGQDPYLEQLLQDLTGFRYAPNGNYRLEERVDYELDPVSILLHDLSEQYPLFRELVGDFEPQALEAFPVPLQCAVDFQWQAHPFEIGACGADDPSDVNAGVDYIVAYWLASYHKLVTKDR